MIEALRRAYRRLFGRPGTSGPHKIEGEGARSIMVVPKGTVVTEDLLALLRDHALRTSPGWNDNRQAFESAKNDLAKQMLDSLRPGVRPPTDPEADGWTWQKWDALARGAGTAPGWAFCRFANRTGPDTVAFVFGLVRGSFGLWQQPFDICTEDNRSSEILTCITHLRSGIGCGIFAERMVAIEAAELADRICEAHLTEIDGDTSHRLHRAWEGVGIRPASNAHCHDGAGNTYELIGRSTDSIMEGKPERLS